MGAVSIAVSRGHLRGCHLGLYNDPFGTLQGSRKGQGWDVEGDGPGGIRATGALLRERRFCGRTAAFVHLLVVVPFQLAFGAPRT